MLSAAARIPRSVSETTCLVEHAALGVAAWRLRLGGPTSEQIREMAMAAVQVTAERYAANVLPIIREKSECGGQLRFPSDELAQKVNEAAALLTARQRLRPTLDRLPPTNAATNRPSPHAPSQCRSFQPQQPRRLVDHRRPGLAPVQTRAPPRARGGG